MCSVHALWVHLLETWLHPLQPPQGTSMFLLGSAWASWPCCFCSSFAASITSIRINTVSVRAKEQWSRAGYWGAKSKASPKLRPLTVLRAAQLQGPGTEASGEVRPLHNPALPDPLPYAGLIWLLSSFRASLAGDIPGRTAGTGPGEGKPRAGKATQWVSRQREKGMLAALEEVLGGV